MKNKMYMDWLKSITETKEIMLWDKTDSCRWMIIEKAEDKGYFNISYYDGFTGEEWNPEIMHGWDVVDILKENKVEI